MSCRKDKEGNVVLEANSGLSWQKIDGAKSIRQDGRLKIVSIAEDARLIGI